MESIKNLKSKISKYISNVFNKIKEIAKNINTPSYANFIYISYFYLIITATIIPISLFIIKRCNVKIDELPFDIYLALSTLMIPLAIFIAQKIFDSCILKKKEAVVVRLQRLFFVCALVFIIITA